jgi:hypothetical protein
MARLIISEEQLAKAIAVSIRATKGEFRKRSIVLSNEDLAAIVPVLIASIADAMLQSGVRFESDSISYH